MCIFPSEVQSIGIVLLSVGFEEFGNLRHQWVIWIRLVEQAANRKEYLADGQGGTPIVLQNVQANATLSVHIAMIDFGDKTDLWWFERIIGWELEFKIEDAICVRGGGRANDGGNPVE